MSVGVVVLTYRGAQVLPACLESVIGQLGPEDHLVVVDNASDDTSAAMVASAYPDVELLELATNDGYGLGMNAGLARLSATGVDAFLLLTHDTVLGPDALDVLVAAMAADARCAVAGPLLELRGGRGVVWSAGGRLGLLASRPSHIGQGAAVGDWRGASPRPVTWLDGAALLVRRAALDGQPQAFCDDFFLYWEEVEFQCRLRDAGWASVLVPAARASQVPGGMPPYLASRNRLRFLMLRGQRGRRLLATAECAARASLLSLIPGRGREGRASWHGVVDGWTGRLDRDLVVQR
jgi:GT2 family glycosyltransferase